MLGVDAVGGGRSIGIGHVGASSGSSRRGRRERSMFRHRRATTVVSQARRFSTSAGVGSAQSQPGLLHGVVGFAQRAQHPVGDRSQMGAIGIELLGQPVGIVHRCTFPSRVRYT